MDFETYEKELKNIDIEFRNKKHSLAREYAMANNPYKIGDKVTDHIGSIRIEKISAYLLGKKPCAMYYGLELKKDGTPKKKGDKRYVWQTNIL